MTAACKTRHRHNEFLAFLKQIARVYPDTGDGATLHLIMDNYAARCWFSLAERQAIHRGTYTSVQDLNTKIRTYVNGWNDRAHPFTWTKTAD